MWFRKPRRLPVQFSEGRMHRKFTLYVNKGLPSLHILTMIGLLGVIVYQRNDYEMADLALLMSLCLAGLLINVFLLVRPVQEVSQLGVSSLFGLRRWDWNQVEAVSLGNARGRRFLQISLKREALQEASAWHRFLLKADRFWLGCHVRVLLPKENAEREELLQAVERWHAAAKLT